VTNRKLTCTALAMLLSATVSFSQTSSIGGIINAYTPVLGYEPCGNKITVENAGPFNIGDTVLMIQMKGAVIDSNNNASFGTITNYNNAGNYEYNYVKGKSGNVIELKNIFLRNYSIPAGKVQLIRVPYYQNANVITTLTCLPWDGNKGGVLVMNIAGDLTLNANIDVSGKGFRGGVGFNIQNSSLNCHQNSYFGLGPNNPAAGEKGESIALLSNNLLCGKGSPAGGGGGALGHNSGGGGGGNGGVGGFGGYQLHACGNAPFDNRGIGGKALAYNSSTNKIFLGSGGGAGQADNVGNTPSSGGNGGGIIIIQSNRLLSNGRKIHNNGTNGVPCTMPPSVDCHDGMGGGGAGGTVLLSINQFVDNSTIENIGGNGANMIGSVPLGGKIGAGGGGGGGLLFLKASALPANISNTNTGGLNGVLTTDNNNPWGATPGQSGTTLFNLVLPFTSELFKPNIDSVRIKDSLVTCSNFDLKGLGFINREPIATWEWHFGDGGTANTQNTTHNYLTPGNYTIKLIVTDINGCKDSITRDVMASIMTMDAGPADTICETASITLQSTANGASSYSWTPTTGLNNPSILNPVASPTATTTYFLTTTNAAGCILTDSVRIEVRASSGFSINPPLDLCINNTVQLLAAGGDLYTWSPAASLDNASIANPIASPLSSTHYTVNIVDTLCGFSSTLSTNITVRPLPIVNASKSNDLDCSTTQSQLNATGALDYLWSPAATLNNPAISSPIARPITNTSYLVTGTDLYGCINKDSVTVLVTKQNKGGYLMPTAFTPNNDGLNDCYGIKYWGAIQNLEFSIYNRWGQRVFFTTNPTVCWDGTVAGVKQNPGVFVFMIKARTECEPNVFQKGTFVLIR
jgi:gliding motility-associated-like protein